ncbi:MAG: putative single-stranded DNA-binding protein [Prokaryotic dsDNA virus sp.]|nr:MAG: putative single-stranded DNA-binding protein [Prokaryotic dsDNA virus sp.]|tara:strand:- start:10896 stop:11306 length:411 start_codon:yes stop_codon:yes gene_type:complete
MTVNKAIIVGNIGNDPEVRQTKSGTSVCNLRVATNERRRTPDGEWSKHTEWHSVVVFGKTADNVGKFLSKGKQAYIEGRLQTSKWTNKEGVEAYKTEIIADVVRFLSNRNDSPDSGAGYKPKNDGYGSMLGDGIPF